MSTQHKLDIASSAVAAGGLGVMLVSGYREAHLYWLIGAAVVVLLAGVIRVIFLPKVEGAVDCTARA